MLYIFIPGITVIFCSQYCSGKAELNNILLTVEAEKNANLCYTLPDFVIEANDAFRLLNYKLRSLFSH